MPNVDFNRALIFQKNVMLKDAFLYIMYCTKILHNPVQYHIITFCNIHFEAITSILLCVVILQIYSERLTIHYIYSYY